MRNGDAGRGVCSNAWDRLAFEAADWREMCVLAQHHAAEDPISGRKAGNSLFLKVKECTIANCWDKMETPVL